MENRGLKLKVNDIEMFIPYIATFEQKNAISALSILFALGITEKKIKKALENLEPIAGRFERVDEGQEFSVIVDYAYEPYAIHALLDAVKVLNPKRIIGIHGSAGGGVISIYVVSVCCISLRHRSGFSLFFIYPSLLLYVWCHARGDGDGDALR